MKKLLLLVIVVSLSPFAYANEATETTHDVRIEARNLGKGPEGKEIIHFKPIDFKHSDANHPHNKDVATLFKAPANAAKHDAKVAAAKPSIHTIRMTTKKGSDGKLMTSSTVVGHDNPNNENNNKVRTLFNCDGLISICSGIGGGFPAVFPSNPTLSSLSFGGAMN
ncbi:MAG: hypothetical protein Q8S31_08110 [Alphaproteobacteria bacterium]|nr:hypothetical protein [Alphaproteobacteria bacterium]